MKTLELKADNETKPEIATSQQTFQSVVASPLLTKNRFLIFFIKILFDIFISFTCFQ